MKANLDTQGKLHPSLGLFGYPGIQRKPHPNLPLDLLHRASNLGALDSSHLLHGTKRCRCTYPAYPRISKSLLGFVLSELVGDLSSLRVPSRWLASLTARKGELI